MFKVRTIGDLQKAILDLGELVKDQNDMIHRLAKIAKQHCEIMDGLNDRIAKLEGNLTTLIMAKTLEEQAQ